VSANLRQGHHKKSQLSFPTETAYAIDNSENFAKKTKFPKSMI